MVECENECDVVSKFVESGIVSCSSLWVVAAGADADVDEDEYDSRPWSWSWSC